MTDFATQLQEMANAIVKTAVEKMEEGAIEAFNETLEKKEFAEVKSYFNDMNTLVWIVKYRNEEAFEIVKESLNRKAPIKTYSDEKEQITIYADTNTGYVILYKSLTDDEVFTRQDYRKIRTILNKKYGFPSGSIFAESA